MGRKQKQRRKRARPRPPDASTLGQEQKQRRKRAHPRPPDASILGVTAINVGMPQADAFGWWQGMRVAELANHVTKWLSDGPTVVGLNEIAPDIAEKLEKELEHRGLDVVIETHESNSLLWQLHGNCMATASYGILDLVLLS